jgi:hypothetical protein
MLVSSIWSVVPTLASSCVAALSVTAWLRSRRRLKQSRLQREALETSSSLLGVESQIVDMMDRGAPLKAVLDILTAAIEKLAPECFCTVLLLDEERQQLREGSAGGLPEEYMHAIDGWP